MPTADARRPWPPYQPDRTRAPCWARWTTCRPSRCGARPRTTGRTCSPSARCSTRWSRGQRPFHRETAAETMTAILKEEPADLATLAPDMPPALVGDHPALPGEAPRRTLPLGPRSGLQPGGAVGLGGLDRHGRGPDGVAGPAAAAPAAAGRRPGPGRAAHRRRGGLVPAARAGDSRTLLTTRSSVPAAAR